MFNFKFTSSDLISIIGANPYADYWYTVICDICPEYHIDTPVRLAAFLAQCAHESGGFRVLHENLNYRAVTLMKTWPNRFPTLEIANQYAKQPKKIANMVYANRMGNGPEESGDGWTYCGKGLIQLTGKENYSWFAASIKTPLEDIPEYLLTFEGAVQSACWFWSSNNINKFADAKDIRGMTKAINGGYLGIEERTSHFNHALKVLRG